jgi:hypothetical protein
MLGAQPADEDQAPMDDPFDHNPPFDFFGLGQPANQNQFHHGQIAQPEIDHPNDNDWDQWLASGANAAPAAQLNAIQNNINFDLNEQEDDNEGVDNNLMELDLNEIPELYLNQPEIQDDGGPT